MLNQTVQVEELAKAKLEKSKRLGELAAKEWREIDDGTNSFGRPEQEAAVLHTLERNELVTFFQVCTVFLDTLTSCLSCFFAALNSYLHRFLEAG